ncbi:hypothetical protein BD310DRAFT_641565 [Dichomitus squalens]|uniref:K Homology domain-containing protein n=1 Tax=Dichomitus squalens TaxID=114155 RepID=A0A4Q9PNZ4_9APHY|nr:hypothetical protein BD310DRAFT_641565 [Dichomitus squalens]
MAHDAPAPNTESTEPISEPRPPGAAGDDGGILSLRALISTKDADTLTREATEGTLELEEDTEVHISEAGAGAADQVLTATGTVAGVAKVYARIAARLVPPAARASPAPSSTSSASGPPPTAPLTLRLLAPHRHLGTLIGKHGTVIRAIEAASGARIVAHKRVLPRSTERRVDVCGEAGAVGMAVARVAGCLRAAAAREETVLFEPGPAERIDDDDDARGEPVPGPEPMTESVPGPEPEPAPEPDPEQEPHAEPPAGKRSRNGRRRERASKTMPKQKESEGKGKSTDKDKGKGKDKDTCASGPQRPSSSQSSSKSAQTPEQAARETRKMVIPEDVVGYILGQNGTNLAWIRRTARARVYLASAPARTRNKGEEAGRVLKIVGTVEAVETAVAIVEKRLERARRKRGRGGGKRQGSQTEEEEDEDEEEEEDVQIVI